MRNGTVYLWYEGLVLNLPPYTTAYPTIITATDAPDGAEFASCDVNTLTSPCCPTASPGQRRISCHIAVANRIHVVLSLMVTVPVKKTASVQRTSITTNVWTFPRSLRVIQIYNSDGYRCPASGQETEDGFALGYYSIGSAAFTTPITIPSTATLIWAKCSALSSFTRLVADSFCPHDGTEDGFCPGA